MRRILFTISVALLASPTAAAELSGPLSRSQPSYALDRFQVQQAISANRGTSLESMRRERTLREARRDFDRDARKSSITHESVSRSDLRNPAFDLPWTADIRGDDRRLGTAKLFIRLGRLLDSAQSAMMANRHADVEALADEIDILAPILTEFQAHDPSVLVRQSQYAQLQAWLDK